jgi:hypothetical protein
MNLLEQYQVLLIAYDKALNLSRKILSELEKNGRESDLLIYLEQKKVVAETIAQLTEIITSTEIGKQINRDSKDLSEMKSALEQITEKAKLIQAVEEKIQKLLRENNTESE